MNSETLNELWRTQSANAPEIDAGQLLERAKAAAVEWEKDYERTDHALFFGTLITFIGLIPSSWLGSNEWTRPLYLLLGIVQVAVLVTVRRRRRQLDRDFGATVLERLDHGVRLMKLRSLLFRASLVYTLILGAGIGTTVMTFNGFPHPRLVAAWLILGAVLVGLWMRANLREDREKLRRSSEVLEELKGSLSGPADPAP